MWWSNMPMHTAIFDFERCGVGQTIIKEELAMPTQTIIDRYFEAFNKHDPEAVAALFAGGGKYIDSAVSSGVKGKALKDYLRGHYAAFPDARYQLLRAIVNRNGLMACEWRFRGTNTGSLGDSPATNRSVELLGASILEAKGEKIAWLHGYYDRRNLFKQLGT